MNETIKPNEENPVIPFALQFLEAVPAVELEEVSGQYNDELQVWEYGDSELSTAFPVASFPANERPGTITTVPTRITPKIVRADPAVDD